jgi:hypothetical protein
MKLERLMHELKQPSEIIVVDKGRQIDRSDEHNVKADAPRIESLLAASNAKLER